MTTLARTVADLFDRHDQAGGGEELFNSLDLVARVDAGALVRHTCARGNAAAEDPVPSQRLALKGETALNVFYLDLDRLSVDIDLNYVGALDLFSPASVLRAAALQSKRFLPAYGAGQLIAQRHPRRP